MTQENPSNRLEQIQNQPTEQRKSDEKFCFSCGKTLHMSAQFCPSCGATHSNEQNHQAANVNLASSNSGLSEFTYCNGCGKQIHRSANSCPHCGAKSLNQVSNIGEKSRTSTIIFALLLGGIGAHKFYLGRVGIGILYLFFCWTFIPAVVALFEGVIYATMSDETFHAKYG